MLRYTLLAILLLYLNCQCQSSMHKRQLQTWPLCRNPNVEMALTVSPGTAASTGTNVTSLTLRDVQSRRKLLETDSEGADASSTPVIGRIVGPNGNMFYFTQRAPVTSGMARKIQRTLQEPVAITDEESEGSEEKSHPSAAVLVPAIVVPVVVFLVCVALYLGMWYRSHKLASVRRPILAQQYSPSI